MVAGVCRAGPGAEGVHAVAVNKMVYAEIKTVYMIGDGGAETGGAVSVAEIRAHDFAQGIASGHVVEIAAENHRPLSGLFNLCPDLICMGSAQAHRFLEFAQKVAAYLAYLAFGLALGYAAVKLLVVVSEAD